MKNMRKVMGLLAVLGGLSLFVIVQMMVFAAAPTARAIDEMPVLPMIVVDPATLANVQLTDSVVTQTLTVSNPGDADLDWHIYDGEVGLWDQTDNASATNGAPSQYFPDVMQGGYAADDFVVPAGQTWQIDHVFIPGSYTPGAGPAPDFDVVVYDDAGGAPDMMVASETAVSPISDSNGDITLALNPPIVLSAGTYWLSVNANMNFEGPPKQWFWTARTVPTGSPYHWMETGVFGTSCTSGWQPGAAVCGVGGGIDPDLVFGMSGDYPNANCDPVSALPWVAVNPVSGTVAVSGTLPVAVAFDATGYMPDVYTGTLCFASNDPLQPLFPVPLTMTVVAQAFGVVIGPDDSSVNLPGTHVNYSLSVMNIGNTADVYTLTVSSIWTTTLSVSSLALDSGASDSVMVTVTIPISATDGEIDTAVITATSQTEISVSDSATLTTMVGAPPPEIFIYIPYAHN